MPGLGSVAGEFEQALTQIGPAEGSLLTSQESVRYEATDRGGAPIGELRVLFTHNLVAQALEFIGDTPRTLEEMDALAQPYLPPDAAIEDEADDLSDDDRILRYYLSAALADSIDLAAASTASPDADPAEVGTLTLEATTTRWLIRPGRWPAVLDLA